MIEEFERHEGAADAAVIALVGSAFDEGRRGHEVRDVLTRGRALRRRKRAVPALTGLGVLAVCAGLAVAPTGTSGAADTPGAQGGHSLTANGALVNVDNAAFSVHTDAKTGKVTVTVSQLVEENELKQVLAKAGIRAFFSSSTLTHVAVKAACTWPGATLLNEAGVINTSRAKPSVVVIDPSKMPSGSVLAFVYFEGALGQFLLSNEPTGGPVGDCV